MYMKEVRPITNVIVVEAFRERHQAVDTYRPEGVVTEASVPPEMRQQYVSLRREFSSMLDHAVMDACLEHEHDMAMTGDLAGRLNGHDVPLCAQQDVTELEACYGRDLLYGASLAVDFEGVIKFQLIPTGSGYAAKWYYLQGA